jgi:hypothetical protein
VKINESAAERWNMRMPKVYMEIGERPESSEKRNSRLPKRAMNYQNLFIPNRV